MAMKKRPLVPKLKLRSRTPISIHKEPKLNHQRDLNMTQDSQNQSNTRNT
jgi:hypothetical protein